MKVTKTEQRTVEVVDDIICNMCGQPCRVYITVDHKHWNFEFTKLDFSGTGNYGSKFDELPPLKIDDVHFCDTCTVKLLAQCQIKPRILDPYSNLLTPLTDGNWATSPA